MTEEKILEVQDVSVFFDKNTSVLIIKTSGIVTSSGWKNPRLVPHSFDQLPPDGIYDFDFVAEPPSDISLPVVMPIEANLRLESMRDNLKGVRIHAQNSKESLLS
jgi:hypothetical protein